MWNVITTECFDEWFDTQSEDLQDEILSVLQILKEVGPNLGRPYVDTLKGSKYP
ncbi:type II toxin-antitoxin system RelE/ParE family toxin, partial [Escherichia coli]